MRNMKKHGFTLAEIMIAITIIGIVAAITLPSLIHQYQERLNSQRQANIVYKVTQATNLMKTNGALLNGFPTTEACVDELQKYLKIMKRCDSDHIDKCWPTKKIKTSNGDEFEVKDAKMRQNLGFNDNYKKDKNVGIVLNDGACLIMTYNPSVPGIAMGDPLIASTKELPGGGRFLAFLEYTSNTTAGLAFVMDVNGGKGPNSEPINNKKYDIRSFNSAHFSTSCPGDKFDGKCIATIDSYSPLDCRRTNGVLNHPEYADYCGSASSLNNDHWAGANKACQDLGMSLPTPQELSSICSNNMEQMGITSGVYWASTLYERTDRTATYARCVHAGACSNTGNCSPRTSNYKALCVD